MNSNFAQCASEYFISHNIICALLYVNEQTTEMVEGTGDSNFSFGGFNNLQCSKNKNIRLA